MHHPRPGSAGFLVLPQRRQEKQSPAWPRLTGHFLPFNHRKIPMSFSREGLREAKKCKPTGIKVGWAMHLTGEKDLLLAFDEEVHGITLPLDMGEKLANQILAVVSDAKSHKVDNSN